MARGRSKAMPGLSGTLNAVSAPYRGAVRATKRATRLAGRKRGGVLRSLGSLARFPTSWGGTKYGRRRRGKR